MDENKQIDEMAEMLEIIAKAREAYANDVTDHTENEYIREGLLDAGYRKQREGEWMLDGRCSKCLTNPLTTHRTYCPNCGAKMKGE